MSSSPVAIRPPGAIFRWIPALDSLRRYNVAAARADILAGFSVAAVAVPQAMAYAMIAGLPAEYGLYTAIVMTAVGALLDSSRQLINGPTNAIYELPRGVEDRTHGSYDDGGIESMLWR